MALLGAVVGIGGAAIVTLIGPTLEATVLQRPRRRRCRARSARARSPHGSTDVALTRRSTRQLILLAIGLAMLGGLIAGAVGGMRAARLRPAEALRSLE